MFRWVWLIMIFYFTALCVGEENGTNNFAGFISGLKNGLNASAYARFDSLTLPLMGGIFISDSTPIQIANLRKFIKVLDSYTPDTIRYIIGYQLAIADTTVPRFPRDKKFQSQQELVEVSTLCGKGAFLFSRGLIMAYYLAYVRDQNDTTLIHSIIDFGNELFNRNWVLASRGNKPIEAVKKCKHYMKEEMKKK